MKNRSKKLCILGLRNQKIGGSQITETVTSHQSPVTSHQSPVPSHQSPVTSHQSPVTSPQSPVPSHQSPVTSPQSNLLFPVLLAIIDITDLQELLNTKYHLHLN
ncbi:hypothetical protein [Sphaerospermopsis reniformis]|uniref:hypothetical protein n=1 Tax=Sphaerospermopsis reniformis TaxID=531300 RepID=UPI0010F7BD36|nr:hypothetical protein [Sphaerospermopsis reniformis]